RHTRLQGDWSSDVCSSDLADKMAGDQAHLLSDTFVFHDKFGANTVQNFDLDHDFLQFDRGMFGADTAAAVLGAAHGDRHGNVVRSEERRVGKECGGGGGAV